ncbi:MAG TPA: NfeD family protein [bacterium]|nr:NfeD family protein [bacterium]
MNLTPTFFWVATGLVLIIAEMFSLSLVLLFFGVAALLVALAKFLGLNNLPWEIVLFAVLGIGSMLLFRNKLKQSLHTQSGISIDQNAVIILTDDIPAHGTASVTYQGVAWTAVNETDSDFKKGNKVYVQRTDGVKLVVLPEPAQGH